MAISRPNINLIRIKIGVVKMIRIDNRKYDQLRDVTYLRNYLKVLRVPF